VYQKRSAKDKKISGSHAELSGVSEADVLRLTPGTGKVTVSSAEERRKQMEKAGADKVGAWHDENPGPDDSAGGADTEDGVGDGVGDREDQTRSMLQDAGNL
jgi:hypothetical protein